MGFFIGALLCMLSLPLTPTGMLRHFCAVVTWSVGWFGSTWLLLRNQAPPSKVLMRGFLLGIAEWLAVIPVVLAAARGDHGEWRGLVPFLLNTFAFGMAVVCLIGFAIARGISRDVQSATSKTAL